MGGLRTKLPVAFVSMAIGSLGLVAFPLTSGFFSKDAILLTAWQNAGWLFWGGGLLAAGLTALYTTRMMVIAFFGETRTEPHDTPRVNMWLPLVLLWVLSIGGGWFGIGVLDDLLGEVLEFSHFEPVALATTLVPLVAIALGWLIFSGKVNVTGFVESAVGRGLRRFFGSGWGFDWLYDRVFVAPFLWLAKVNKSDFVDYVYRIAVGITRGFHHVGALTQTGRLRWYAVNMALGLILVVLIVAVS